MKILILSEWFDPEPSFKGLPFARELVARGHEVEVLTGFPNYPGGKLYPGYRVRPWKREAIEGIPVLRVALYPSHDTSAVRRIFTYFSFAISASVLGALLANPPELIYAYSPPATVGLPAMLLSAIWNIPFVYDLQDLWPDTLAATGMLQEPRTLRLVGKWCDVIYRRASRIIALSSGFRSILLERGVPSKKIEVVYNWCDEEALQTHGQASRLSASGRFSVLFAGTMGLAQDLETVLAAAEICQTIFPEAEFIFVGGGVEREKLISIARERRVDNVRFLPRRPIREMAPVLAGADVLLVHLKDDPLFRVAIPSKTQAYLATGKPILMAVAGNAADLIEAAGAGMTCAPGDPASVAQAVKKLGALGEAELAAMGNRGRQYYNREMSLAAGVSKLERIFQNAISEATNHSQRP